MSCNEITSPTFELLEHFRLISSSPTRLCQTTDYRNCLVAPFGLLGVELPPRLGARLLS
jgi:hypothetical protein